MEIFLTQRVQANFFIKKVSLKSLAQGDFYMVMIGTFSECCHLLSSGSSSCPMHNNRRCSHVWQ